MWAVSTSIHEQNLKKALLFVVAWWFYQQEQVQSSYDWPAEMTLYVMM